MEIDLVSDLPKLKFKRKKTAVGNFMFVIICSCCSFSEKKKKKETALWTRVYFDSGSI